MATEVDVTIKAQIEGALKNVQKFSSQASKAISGISDSFLNLKTLAGAAIAGIGFSRLIAAAAEQEQAVQKLNTALALTGELSEENTQDFLDFASSLQQASTVGDEVSLGLIGLAKSFGASNEQAKQILQTAADLSAVTGESLESSVRNLSKTLGGLKGELGETQPELRGLTKEQLENGEAITVLGEKYEGAAKALTKTFSGALTQTQNSFGDLLEELGKFLTSNPAVIGAINLASEVFNELGSAIKDNDGVLESLIEDGLLVFTDLLPDIIRLVGKFVVGLQSLKFIFDAIKLASISFALDTTRAVDFLIEAFASLTVGALVPFLEGLELVVKGLEAVGAVSEGTADGIAKSSRFLTDGIFEVGNALDGTVDSLTGFRDEARVSLQDTSDAISTTAVAFENSALRADSFSTRLKILTEEAKNSDDSLKRLSESNKDLADSTRKSSEEIANQKKALDDLKKGLAGIESEVQKAQDAANPIAALQRQQKEREKILEESRKKQFISQEKFNQLILKSRSETDRKIADASEKINRESIQKQIDEEDKIRKKVTENINAGAVGLITTGLEGLTGAIQNFFSDNKIDLSTLFDGQALTGQALGATNDLLAGAEGARSLLVSGASLAADAFLPGIGQAVGPIVNALSQGPEFVKEQVTAFAEAIPVLLDNIAKAIPVLIDVLADKAPEIVVALVKAGPAISKAIIIGLNKLPFILAREIIIEITKAFDDIFGTTLTTDFENAADKFAGTTEDLQEKYVTSVQDGIERITQSLQTGLNTFTSSIQTFVSSIGSGISTAIGDVGAQISGAFSGPIDSLTAITGDLSSLDLASGLQSVFKGLSELFDDLFAFSFPDLPEFSFPALPDFSWPELPSFEFPDFKQQIVDGFNQIIEDLKNALKIEVPDIGGGGGGNVFERGRERIEGFFATGGRVPDGFPNDSFRAGLTSGEEIIDTSTSEQLRDFLNGQESGRDVNIVLQIGEKQLADVLLNINRQGFRVS